MRPFILAFCLLAIAACDESPTTPTSPLGSDFVLAPGEVMGIEDASLSVRFDGVSGDSRCPADAVCIQGGSADVHITVIDEATTHEYVLETGDMRPVQHEGVTIALVQLSPYPFSARTIEPEEYRATLRATR